MSDRQGVEIDYCPRCRGVWLDRGELDKIIERTATIAPPAYREPERDEDWRESKYREDDRYQPPKKKKRESFLGDLFDF
jgi:Zn-finger nucleic acid-binding protein